MTYKKMLLLAALLVGLALYITKIELANDEIKIATEQPLVTYPPQAFLEVSVAGPKGNFTLVNANPKTEVKKGVIGDDSLSVEDAAQWKLRNVVGGEVDRGALNTLLAALRNLKLENALTAEDTDKDLGVYGLAKPELSVDVKVAAINRTLQLGKLNEFVKKRYLKDSQSPSIYLASDELFNAASKSASDIRDHLPLKLDDAQLTKFSLETVAGKIVIERDGEKWKIASPGPYSASYYAVSGLLREIRNSKVASFIDDGAGNDSKFGLDTPVLTVGASLKSGEKVDEQQIKFGRTEETKEGKKVPHFFVKVSGKDTVYELTANPTTRIIKTVNELREHQLVKLATDKVVQVVLEVPSRESVTLTRAEGVWKVNGKDADAPFVDELLSSAGMLEAADFPDQQSDLGFGAPAARLTFTLKSDGTSGAPETKVLIVGKQVDKPQNGYAAMVEGSNEPFTITAESFKKITPRLESLYKSEPSPDQKPTATAGPDHSTPVH